MDQENILYRILSGYYFIDLDNQKLKAIMPTLQLKQEAHFLYLKYLDQYKYEDHYWLSSSQINFLLNHYNLWNSAKEAQYKELQNKLEDTKIDLYLNYIDIKLRKKNHDLIQSLNKLLHKFYIEKNYFDNLTLESYCNSLKNQYLIMNCIYDINNNKLFNIEDFNSIDSSLLDDILYQIYHNTLSIDDLKSFAKSDIWRSYWDSKKENVFDKHVLELTDDQRTLINISKTFDAIKEHLDSPPEDIFNDNDALEGWMLHQFREKEKEKKKTALENRASTTTKSKSHSNVFIMSENEEDAQNIYSLNDATTRHQIRNMIKTVKEKKSMDIRDIDIFKLQQNKE